MKNTKTPNRNFLFLFVFVLAFFFQIFSSFSNLYSFSFKTVENKYANKFEKEHVSINFFYSDLYENEVEDDVDFSTFALPSSAHEVLFVIIEFSSLFVFSFHICKHFLHI
ncbi:MAG: hypothetical protein HYZ42_02795 [Bacteroidetes bacterium]|nr:hypothetical protein [Bacteroidota bacterium]